MIWNVPKRIWAELQAIRDDKARKAIEGMLPCDTADTVSQLERAMQDLLAGDMPDIPEAVRVVLAALRSEVRVLALAHTKLQSDMAAIQIQRANEANFALTMGDAFKFTAFLEEHFKQDVLGHPELKTLEVAEVILRRLMENAR